MTRSGWLNLSSDMAKVKVYFVGVDYWNRPTFREIRDGKRLNRYYCDVFKLFDYGTSEDEVLKWYTAVGTSNIVYKGSMFVSEPDGGTANVEIIRKEDINHE